MKPRIKAVIFDFGGVALDFSFQGEDAHIAHHLGISAHHVSRACKRHAVPAHHGRISNQRMTSSRHLQALAHDLNVPVDKMRRAYHKALDATQHIRPAVIRLVKDLQKRGYRTPLISNTCALYAESNVRNGWFKHFSPRILSHEVGCKKPDKRIYQVALRKIRAKPAECVFIDDKEVCLKPARRMGIHVIKYTTLTRVKNKLKKLGVL
jgi:putative hydrolase of the HAD superfamily